MDQLLHFFLKNVQSNTKVPRQGSKFLGFIAVCCCDVPFWIPKKGY
jgi:hypothetical protein